MLMEHYVRRNFYNEEDFRCSGVEFLIQVPVVDFDDFLKEAMYYILNMRAQIRNTFYFGSHCLSNWVLMEWRKKASHRTTCSQK